MSEPSVWHAVYSSSAFSTVFMSQEELEEALKVYPKALSQTFSSFEDACAWLEETQTSSQNARKVSTGCVRTEKEKPRDHSLYKKPTPSFPTRDSPGPSNNPSSSKAKPRLSGRSEQKSRLDVAADYERIYEASSIASKTRRSSRSSYKSAGERQTSGADKNRGDQGLWSEEKGPDGLPKHVQAGAGAEQVTLSSEQKHVLEMVLAGESVFFTGSAGRSLLVIQCIKPTRLTCFIGTGKSVLLREIIRQLQSRHVKVAVTASTGIAAINIGGKTLHSFAGVGLGNQHASNLIKKARNKRTTQRWKSTEVLIIDEVSMVDARWFDILDEIGKTLRNSDRPFGGMQLVVCGDFFQLPPVPEQSYIDAGIPISFAFEAKCWDEAVPNLFTLTQVFRQKQSKLVDMLNNMRLGVVSEASSELFHSLSRKVEYNDGILPTQIFPLRRLADAANRRQMDSLKGKEVVLEAIDEFGKDIYGAPITPDRGRSLLDKKVADRIELKVGAQVMCIQNLPESGIVNGSIGVITHFSTPQEARVAPEVLITIPSSDPNWKSGDKAPISQQSRWEGARWPVVRYQNGQTVMMTPFAFTHENADGGVEATRNQVPLILAWALTVHKAQGQTLERVKVDLEGTFEKGQAYVALSRCTTLDGLEVQHFSPALVFAHPKVIEWARTLAVVPDDDPHDNSRHTD